MTLQEAYDRALAMDGIYASVSHSLQRHPDEEIGTFETFSVSATEIGLFGHGDSWDDCFSQIESQDPEERKAEKIASLKAKLAELES